MKKIYYILATVLLVVFSSCNEEWLDTAPSGDLATPILFTTTEGGYLAINGLSLLTQSQHLTGDFGSSAQGMNGEGTIKYWINNYAGNNFVDDGGLQSLVNQTNLINETSAYNYYCWYYYYRIIGNANAILDNIDAAEGPEEDKLEIKAVATTYRAYAYFMLSQIYCYRWSDSNNGESQGLPLRLSSDTEDDFPFSPLKDVYTQVYKDLDDAINLFTQSGKTRGANHEMNIDVAQAIYARAALTREDYVKAEAMASTIRKSGKYPLMTNEEALSGFYTPNKEWIWSSYGGSDQNLYYFSFFAQIAYNSNASAVRTSPACITKELFNKVPETDIRREWFWDGKEAVGRITDKNIEQQIRAKYPKIASNASFWNYMQFKFACEVIPGVGNLNHFRSAEMYLIEAEAIARQNKGRDSEAQALMIALNKDSGRDPNYTCSKTGNDLIEEIMTYRGIELWGEGFEWFDLKRTKGSINRSRRTQLGSFLDQFVVAIGPEANNKWTWVVPVKEYDYNSLAKPEQ